MKRPLMLLATMLAIVVLGNGCHSLSEEERKEKEKTVREAYANLGQVYKDANQYIEDLYEGKIEVKFGCDAENDPKSDPKSLNVIHILELKKFTAKDAEEFERFAEEWEESEWHWMSTERSILDDDFHSLPEDLSDKDLSSAEYWISNASWGSIFYDTEFALVVPDPEDTIKMHMPYLLDDDEAFISGYFSGFGILFTRDNNEIVCSRPFAVKSSESVEFKDYGGRRGNLLNELSGGGDPEKAVKDNFIDRFKAYMRVVFKNYELGDLHNFQ